LGADGLDCTDGTHLLLADDPGHFIDSVSKLLSSSQDRVRIASAGRRLLEDRYTWPAAWRILDSILGNSLASRTV
jgi:hypothetical protein